MTTGTGQPHVLQEHIDRFNREARVLGSGESLGERNVVFDFNPSNHDDVTYFKMLAAVFINAAAFLGDGSKGAEAPRWASLAKTAAEEASMWAVKAATSKPGGHGWAYRGQE